MGFTKGDLKMQLIKENCALMHDLEADDFRIITRGTSPLITGEVVKNPWRRRKDKNTVVLSELGPSHEAVVSKLCDASSVAMEEHFQKHGYKAAPGDKKRSQDLSDDSDSGSDSASASSSSDSEDEGSVLVRPRGKAKDGEKTPVPAPPKRRVPPFFAQKMPTPSFSPPNGPQRVMPHHPCPPAPFHSIQRPMVPPVPHGPMGKPPGMMGAATPPAAAAGIPPYRGPAMPHCSGASSPPGSGLARIQINFVNHGSYEIAATVAFHAPGIFNAARKHCEGILGSAKTASYEASHLRVVLKAVGQGATRIAVQELLHDLTPLVRSLPVTEGVPVFEVEVKNLMED